MTKRPRLRRLSGALLAFCGGLFLALGAVMINDGLFGGIYIDTREFSIGIVVVAVCLLLTASAIVALTPKKPVLRWYCLGSLAIALTLFGTVEFLRNSCRDQLFYQTGETYVSFKTKPDGEIEIVRDFGSCAIVVNPSTRKWLVVPQRGIRRPRWYESSTPVLVTENEDFKEMQIPYKFVGTLHVQ